MSNPGPISLFLPLIVLLTSLATLPFTIITLALQNRLSDLTSWSKIRHAWFAQFFSWFGPASKSLFAPTVGPLLAQAQGVVLDIGPGNGVWMHELAAAKAITKIYGVEPNTKFHGELERAAKRDGLADLYEPVACGAQDLEALGVMKGSVDTVVTVHVMCSVGNQADEIASGLYALLKPGGQWLVYEHVASPETPARLFQGMLTWFTPSRRNGVGCVHAIADLPILAGYSVVSGILCDGCNLTRDTEQIIRAAGEWESVSIGSDPREGYFECLPHVVGRLVKKKE
jgi:SAM-dependent methyltransferase